MNWKTISFLIGIGLVFQFDATAFGQSTMMPSGDRTLLVQRCDALLASAIVQPSGTGWQTDVVSHGDVQSIDLRRGATPAAAMVLYRAGRVLHDPRLTKAALNVVHVMLICQNSSGRMPEEATLAQFAVGHDVPHGGRDRASTIAAMGLFLDILQSQDARDKDLVKGAELCATWLNRQQLRSGGWRTDLPDQSDNPGLPAHIFKLDSSDWRDCTLAMLMAGTVLNRPDLWRAGEEGCNTLIVLQLNDSKTPWARGWVPAYHLSGVPLKGFLGEPYAMSTAATIYSGQTLLARYLLTYDQASADSLRMLAALKPLRIPSGSWYRLYGLPGSPHLPSTRPETVGALPRMFAPVTTQPDQSALAPPGLDELLAMAANLPQLHLDASGSAPVQGQSGPFNAANVQRGILSDLCGVTDVPIGKLDDSTPPDDQLARQIVRIEELVERLEAQ